MLTWLQFFGAAVLVVIGGKILTDHAERLAAAKGLTRLWLGFILLAGATSIPELATAVGAVTLADSPALALGDLLGSNAFNIFIISLLGLFFKGRSILHPLSLRPFRLLLSSSAIMTVVVLGDILARRMGIVLNLGHLDVGAIILLSLYLASSYLVFQDERKSAQTSGIKPSGKQLGPGFYLSLGLSLGAVIAAGCWLSISADKIARITGWGATFVGALFLALVTSLPEVVVSLSAIRLGSADMALGNIFGSNIFNLTIIFWADLADGSGPLLGAADNASIGTGILALTLTGIAATGLGTRMRTRLWGTRWDTTTIALVYLAGMYAIFCLSAGN